MSSLKKKCKVLMLPTDNKSNLVLGLKTHNLYSITPKERNVLGDNSIQFQHLYIISDDEVKEGDWYIVNNIRLTNEIRQSNGNKSGDQYQKIIATTNRLIQTKEVIGRDEIGNLYNPIFLPQPSPQFIAKFVESYNKGQVITDVLVEYNDRVCKCSTIEQTVNCCFSSGDDCTAPNPNNDFYGLKPKVDSSNCITIKKVKDSYTKEEVIQLLHKIDEGHELLGKDFINQFVEQHL
jgi:hypothetical protein